MTGAIVIEPDDLPLIEGMKYKVIGESTAMSRSLLVAVSIEKEDLQEIVNKVIKLKKTKGKVLPLFSPSKHTA
jgi:hypothetical protein